MFRKKRFKAIFLILPTFGIAIIIVHFVDYLLLPLLPDFGDYVENTIDAFITSILLLPVVYFSLIKPLIASLSRNQNAKEELLYINQELEINLKQKEKLLYDSSIYAEFSKYLQTCNTQEEIITIAKIYMSKLFSKHAVGIYLYSKNNNFLYLADEWGFSEHQPVLEMNPQSCLALRQGQNHISIDTNSSCLCEHLKSYPHSNYACFPLGAHQKSIGVLYINTIEKSVDEYFNNLVLNICRDLALSIDNINLIQQLQEQNIQDPLTGLMNRRYLMDIAEREISRAHRKNLTLAVAMLDIDFFKKINDTYGHSAGDKVLQEVSALIKNSIRVEDFAFRFGGEEFLILFSDIYIMECLEKIESIRKRMELISIIYGNIDIPRITISAGIAVFPLNGNTAEILIKIADAALYKAKENGRNQTVMAAPDVSVAPSNSI